LFDIDEIVVAVPDIPPEVALRLQEKATALGLRLRMFSAQLIEVDDQHAGYPDLPSHKQRKATGDKVAAQSARILT
jgi:hypothetical protein